MQYNPDTYRHAPPVYKATTIPRLGPISLLSAQDRRCLFGDIHKNKMRLNSLGTIVTEQWYAMPERFSRLELDAFVAMPNHIHGILVIPPVDRHQQSTSVGTIVGAYKSLCVYSCLR